MAAAEPEPAAPSRRRRAAARRRRARARRCSSSSTRVELVQTQVLGGALGGAFALLAAALIVTAAAAASLDRGDPEDYPDAEHPEEQEEVARSSRESGSGITRKRLLGAARRRSPAARSAPRCVAPARLARARSLDTEPAQRDAVAARARGWWTSDGRPWSADDIERRHVLHRVPRGRGPRRDRRAAGRGPARRRPTCACRPSARGWAPEGILAYSKICTHAGCAIALYRNPLFQPVEPTPALVCPCHYSTFDPARGRQGALRAGRPAAAAAAADDRRRAVTCAPRGNFSGPVGPSWWGVRSRPTSS